MDYRYPEYVECERSDQSQIVLLFPTCIQDKNLSPCGFFDRVPVAFHLREEEKVYFLEYRKEMLTTPTRLLEERRAIGKVPIDLNITRFLIEPENTLLFHGLHFLNNKYLAQFLDDVHPYIKIPEILAH